MGYIYEVLTQMGYIYEVLTQMEYIYEVLTQMGYIYEVLELSKLELFLIFRYYLRHMSSSLSSPQSLSPSHTQFIRRHCWFQHVKWSAGQLLFVRWRPANTNYTILSHWNACLFSKVRQKKFQIFYMISRQDFYWQSFCVNCQHNVITYLWWTKLQVRCRKNRHSILLPMMLKHEHII